MGVRIIINHELTKNLSVGDACLPDRQGFPIPEITGEETSPLPKRFPISIKQNSRGGLICPPDFANGTPGQTRRSIPTKYIVGDGSPVPINGQGNPAPTLIIHQMGRMLISKTRQMGGLTGSEMKTDRLNLPLTSKP